MHRGQTRSVVISLHIAPASNISHCAVWLSAVMHTIPKLLCFRASEILSNQIVPFAISSYDMKGSTNWMTSGSHLRNSSATDRLRGPDQLRNIGACIGSALLGSIPRIIFGGPSE